MNTHNDRQLHGLDLSHLGGRKVDELERRLELLETRLTFALEDLEKKVVDLESRLGMKEIQFNTMARMVLEHEGKLAASGDAALQGLKEKMAGIIKSLEDVEGDS